MGITSQRVTERSRTSALGAMVALARSLLLAVVAAACLSARVESKIENGVGLVISSLVDPYPDEKVLLFTTEGFCYGTEATPQPERLWPSLPLIIFSEICHPFVVQS